MTEETKKNWYIHGQRSDSIFIILCPLIALIITALICEPRYKNYIYNDLTPFWFAIMASLLTHAHVLLVFTRSHLNADIFKRYKYRFTLIPLILFIGMCTSYTMLITLGIVAIYWDEWHSIMQTFGFGRIYDGKKTNNPLTGRKLDMGMAFVVGLLPSLVLFTYLPNSQISEALYEYLALPLIMIKKYGWILTSARLPLITFGLAYIVFYILSYRKLIQNGYHFSKAKLFLFLTTGITTVLIAYFYTIADGIFFGNIYHAIQYIFIVFISERENLSKIVKKENLDSKEKNHKIGTLIFFIVIIPAVFIFAGLRQMTENEQVQYIGAFWLLTSLMHFWFDGFIWSVRRKDI